MTTPAAVRPCTICNQEDNHPRDIKDFGGGHVSVAHLQCCAAAFKCTGCAQQIAGVEDLRGDDLRAHITAQTPQEG